MGTVRVYKMTNASGFAPNPFGGILTLACCKPQIRNVTKEGDVIIGIGSRTMENNYKKRPATFNNKIIYAMEVEKVIPWTEYYEFCKNKEELKCKYQASGNDKIDMVGDCIYLWNKDNPNNPKFANHNDKEACIRYISNFRFIDSCAHSEKREALHDLGGKYVLIGNPNKSFYLGKKCITWNYLNKNKIKVNRAAFGIVLDSSAADDLFGLFEKKNIPTLKQLSQDEIRKRLLQEHWDKAFEDCSKVPLEIKKEEVEEQIRDLEDLKSISQKKIERVDNEPIIVLSRKGFDSCYGRTPSLIINKKIISFPIPESDAGDYDYCYKDLRVKVNGNTIDLESLILASVGKEKKTIFSDSENRFELEKGGSKSKCHLDPQLQNYFELEENFIASLGQMGIAEKTLEKYSIRSGDLFLFFGNFMFADEKTFRLKEKYGWNDFFHCLWGYMEVGKIVNPKTEEVEIPEYVKRHNPHTKYESDGNRIYIASDTLSNQWCPVGFEGKIKGYGIFDYDNKLILSRHGKENRNKWKIFPLKVNNREYKELPMRGQEFILYPYEKGNKVEEIFKNIIASQKEKFLINGSN